MSDNNVIKLAQPGVFTDSLTEVLRSGARALLTQAVEAEVAEFLAKHADLKTETGHQRVVRHGHLPERDELQMCELDLAGARPARQGSREIADTPVIRAPARGIFGLDALALSSLALACHRRTGKRGPGPGEG